MFNVVLVEPEIPPNTGNIIRLCANTGAQLHLIEPVGFRLDHAKLRRAGLDYYEYVSIRVHRNWQTFMTAEAPAFARMFAFTTRGAHIFDQCLFAPGDWFVFGPETRGLADAMLAQFAPDRRVRLPMRPNSRSLNLSNAAAIVVFNAWRQHGYQGGR